MYQSSLGSGILVLFMKSFPHFRVNLFLYIFMSLVHLAFIDLCVCVWSEVRTQIHFSIIWKVAFSCIIN